MRIGILTGGGDCPGLNAVIRACVRCGTTVHRDEFIGYRHGWKGLIEGESVVLDQATTRGLLTMGGTMLGTSRTNPFSTAQGSDALRATLQRDAIDALVVIGGEDTLGVAARLADEGVRVVGVPKTIDNDLDGTDFTFGFHTAVQTATDAIDRLHTTAESHDRVMVVEVMGRHAGWIAVYSAMAGGADIVLVPEEPFDIRAVVQMIEHRHASGARYSIVVVAEGAASIVTADDLVVQSDAIDGFGHIHLGGVGAAVARDLERLTGFETRVTVLGHLLRGGTPTAYDRVLATRFGIAAIDALHAGATSTMVALHGTNIVRIPIGEAVAALKTVEASLLRDVRMFAPLVS